MSMDNNSKKPIVLAFAGPNGSGKSTVTRGLSVLGTYVNADDIKKEYNLSDLEAAEQADQLRNSLIENRADFSFETVLSTERNLTLLKKAKTFGYEVQCIYVLTSDENINIARVKARVASGGHDVPEDKIRKRYHRALALIPQLVDACDKILIFDNSDKPLLIFKKENAYAEMFPNDFWSESALKKLLKI